MEERLVNYVEQIPPEDWGKTPISVKKLVEEMAQQIKEQEKKLTEVLTVQEQLLEKVNQTSKNSSLPPSRDLPGVVKKQTSKKSGKKRGGQPGHKGSSRELYPIEDCSSIIEHHPPYCPSCGEAYSWVRHKTLSSPNSRNSTH
jgi:transposase